MSDTAAYIQALEVSNPLLEPVIRSAIQALDLPPGSHGLDAGCGIGRQALLLAEAVGPAGHVTGLDISPALLQHAKGIVQMAGLLHQISFQAGDVRRLPFGDGTLDWAWSSCCVGYSAALPPVPTLQELARVVRSGGTVAILVWSSENLLPGYPLLEARLKATTPGLAPFVAGSQPESHCLRALGWFRAAGLEACAARTFVGGAHAPLRSELRQALIALLEMRWPNAEAELTAEDRSAYRRLCRPASPDFILDQRDYYAFFTCSMFWGQVAVAPLAIANQVGL
ncbi:MAG: methyltransferase domain-containing protein [Anaerolineae bacterium]|nr:methyltransferase domain-containing protein [Anaerolineae bacterium]